MTAAPARRRRRPPGQLEKLARRGTASVVGAGFSAVFGILLVVIVTNGFSPTVAGTLFAATSAFLILRVGRAAGHGHRAGPVAARPARVRARGRPPPHPGGLGRPGPRVRPCASAVALYATAPALAPHLVGAGRRATMTVMLRALALVLPGGRAARPGDGRDPGRGLHAARRSWSTTSAGSGCRRWPCWCVYLAGGGALALALAWSLPYVLGLAVGRRLAARSLVARTTIASGTPTPWRTLAREFWAFTAPRAIARVTQTALKRSDIVLVAALASPADAALYTAATRFVVLGQLFVQSVQQALSPAPQRAVRAGRDPGRQLRLPGRHALEHDRRLAALPGDWRGSRRA